jgi:flagellar biosynthesis component FlhA
MMYLVVSFLTIILLFVPTPAFVIDICLFFSFLHVTYLLLVTTMHHVHPAIQQLSLHLPLSIVSRFAIFILGVKSVFSNDFSGVLTQTLSSFFHQYNLQSLVMLVVLLVVLYTLVAVKGISRLAELHAKFSLDKTKLYTQTTFEKYKSKQITMSEYEKRFDKVDNDKQHAARVDMMAKLIKGESIVYLFVCFVIFVILFSTYNVQQAGLITRIDRWQLVVPMLYTNISLSLVSCISLGIAVAKQNQASAALHLMPFCLFAVLVILSSQLSYVLTVIATIVYFCGIITLYNQKTTHDSDISS